MHCCSAFPRTHAILRDTKLLNWELRCAVRHGPRLAPGELAAEQDSFGEVVTMGRWCEANLRLDTAIPDEASAGASHADRRATIRQYRTVQNLILRELTP